MPDSNDVYGLFVGIRPFLLTVEERIDLDLTFPFKDSDKEVLYRLVRQDLKSNVNSVSIYIVNVLSSLTF